MRCHLMIFPICFCIIRAPQGSKILTGKAKGSNLYSVTQVKKNSSSQRYCEGNVDESTCMLLTSLERGVAGDLKM